MQRLTTVAWTMDNKYILSGSDEMNIRIWKAQASEKLGVLKPREKLSLEYNEALKVKYASHPQVSKIKRHRHVPKYIYNARSQLRMARQRILRKYVYNEYIRLVFKWYCFWKQICKSKTSFISRSLTASPPLTLK